MVMVQIYNNVETCVSKRKRIKRNTRKIFIVFLFLILIASSCTQAQQTEGLKILDMRDVVTFSMMRTEGNNNVITKNLLIDKNSKQEQEIQLTGGTFWDILPMQDFMSVSQYYSSRLIMGALNGGGRSIELVKDADGNINVTEHHFNIVFYDEKETKYVTQSREGEEGFNILDEKLTKIDFIPLPVSEDEINSGFIYPYNLETIFYVGDVNGKKFQLQKYDMETKQWQDVVQLLSKEEYNGYGGYASMSYSEQYPDWASFTINSLWAQDHKSEPKGVNTLYFVNLKTGEIKTEPIPLFSEEPVVTMPGLNVSFMQSKDRIVLLDMNPAGAKVLEELYVENLVPFGEQHINNIVQYTGDDMIFATPDGLIKYDFTTKQSEYVYDMSYKE
jgi:hypothetical protein